MHDCCAPHEAVHDLERSQSAARSGLLVASGAVVSAVAASACCWLPLLLLTLGLFAGDNTQEIAADAEATVLLSIEGMACEACAAQVQTALTKVSGGEAAWVNYADGRAIVAVHPDSPPRRGRSH